MKEPITSKVLRMILYVIFVLGIVIILTLPFLLEYYTSYFYDAYYLNPGYRRFIIAFLMLSGVLGDTIVWIAIQLMKSIPSNPFTAKNVTNLKRIGILANIIALIFLLKCVVYPTFLTLLSSLLFFVGGLFVFTLSNLFRQVVRFKEENDLTI